MVLQITLKLLKKYLGAISLRTWVVAILIIVAFVWVFLLNGRSGSIVDKSTYQAVFLSNDQIYFGHLENIPSQYLVLKDVYYVQLEEAIGGGNNKTAPKTTTGRLVKLGANESHGPQNEMIINREHILFWENLRPDSQIVRTIKSLESH